MITIWGLRPEAGTAPYLPAYGCLEPELVIYRSRKQTARDKAPSVSVRPSSSTGITASAGSAADALQNRWKALKRENALPAVTLLHCADGASKPSELETPSALGIDEICLMKDDFHRKAPWAVIASGDENTAMEVLRATAASPPWLSPRNRLKTSKRSRLSPWTCGLATVPQSVNRPSNSGASRLTVYQKSHTG